mmetsp:Transcript_9327/g.24059  ORF Transcript_9327/g.24059 Transcript_9327/m.24059 type:complete len:452 (-) Transcript_9327:343-1698(-)
MLVPDGTSNAPDLPPNPVWWDGGGSASPTQESTSSSGTAGQIVSQTSDFDDLSGNGNSSGAAACVRTEDVAEGSSSAEDRLGGLGGDRVSVGDGCSESSFHLPTLGKDGPVNSSGSTGHPDNCKPCAFYCFSLRGCRNGVECAYCHLFHESKLRQRREEWKKSQRDKRRKHLPQRAGELASTDAETSAEVPDSDRGPPNPQSVPSVAYAAEGGAPPPVPIHALAPSPRAEPNVEVKRRVPEASVPAAALAAAAAPARTEVPVAMQAWCNPTVPVTMPCDIGSTTSANSAVVVNGGVPTRLPWPQAQPPPQPQPQRYPQAPPARTGDAALGPLEVFTYTPSAAVIGIGQTLELWPPVHMASAGMVFAVSPELPKGLLLDERMGLVYGKAERTTEGLVKYYITACEPGDSSLAVKLAVVGLRVMDVQGPSRKAKHPCELRWASSAQPQAARVV